MSHLCLLAPQFGQETGAAADSVTRPLHKGKTRDNGSHPHPRRKPPERHNSDFGRQERRPATDDRLAADAGTLTLSNVPRLADVRLLQRILQNHGIDIMVAGKRAGQNGMAGDVMHLTARDIVDTTAPYELVSKMRASFWVLGPLLARCGEAKVSLPGGCAIGTLPSTCT